MHSYTHCSAGELNIPLACPKGELINLLGSLAYDLQVTRHQKMELN